MSSLNEPFLIGVRRNDYTVTDARTIYGLAFLFAQIFGTIGLLAFDSIASSVMIQAAFFITVAAYSSKKGINMQNAAKFKGCDWRFIVLAIAVVPFSLMLVMPLQELWMSFLELLGVDISSLVGGSTATTSVLEAVVYTVVVSIGPMIGEETLMRGAVVNGYANDKGRIKAIFISAALFTALHGNALQFVNPFVSGAIMALLMIKSDSILPGMLVHFVNNFSVTVISYTCESQVDAFIESNLVLLFFVGLVGLAAIVFAIIKLGKNVKLDNKPVYIQPSSEPVDASMLTESEKRMYSECYIIKKQNDSKGVIWLIVAVILCAVSFIASLMV